MVLIGCKTDLRKDKEQLRKLRAAQLEPITYTQVSAGPSPPSPPGAQAPAQPWPKRRPGLWPRQQGASVAFCTVEANRILRTIAVKY